MDKNRYRSHYLTIILKKIREIKLKFLLFNTSLDKILCPLEKEFKFYAHQEMLANLCQILLRGSRIYIFPYFSYHLLHD